MSKKSNVSKRSKTNKRSKLSKRPNGSMGRPAKALEENLPQPERVEFPVPSFAQTEAYTTEDDATEEGPSQESTDGPSQESMDWQSAQMEKGHVDEQEAIGAGNDREQEESGAGTDREQERIWAGTDREQERIWAGTDREQEEIDPQKAVDSAATGVVSLRQSSIPTTEQEQKFMTLTLKSLSKNGKRAIYVGAAQGFHIPVGAFPNQTPPASFSVSDGVFAPPKVKEVKPKLTAEERKAARAAKPKPTLAERAAAARKRADALEAKAGAVHASM